ncbi:hypothetical protein Senen09_00501 [Salmonella enterica subsp. enterica]
MIDIKYRIGMRIIKFIYICMTLYSLYILNKVKLS